MKIYKIAQTTEDIVKLKSLLLDKNISNLTCVHWAKKALEKGDYMGAIKCLMVDADKIRPSNRELYDIINRY